MSGDRPSRISSAGDRRHCSLRIGAFAAELYEAPIPRTQDVDVTPDTAQPNLARLSAALDERLLARSLRAAVAAGWRLHLEPASPMLAALQSPQRIEQQRDV